MTPGRIAYEADVLKTPRYHDGAPRKTWEQLGEVEQWSWNRPVIVDEVEQFSAMVRSICPVGGQTDEYGIRLGNVEFWIDADGPWAGQLSFSIPTSYWDKKRVAADLTAALKMNAAERKIQFEGKVTA